jgi:hypothetical protein
MSLVRRARAPRFVGRVPDPAMSPGGLRHLAQSANQSGYRALYRALPDGTLPDRPYARLASATPARRAPTSSDRCDSRETHGGHTVLWLTAMRSTGGLQCTVASSERFEAERAPLIKKAAGVQPRSLRIGTG